MNPDTNNNNNSGISSNEGSSGKETYVNKSVSKMEENEVSFREIITKLQEWFKYLVSKWFLILAAGLIGGGIGLTYSIFFNKSIYTAELTFALEEDNGGAMGGGALSIASQFGLDLGGKGGGAFAGDNLLMLMKSRSMVEKALLTSVNIGAKEQTLAELYISFNNIRKGWLTKPDLKDIKFLPRADRSKFSLKQDSVLGLFYKAIVSKNLTVEKKDKKLSIIVLKVNSENEMFSKLFAETLTRDVGDFYVETKTKKSSQNVAVLQYQTDSVRRALNSAISGVASFIDANPNANGSRQLLRVPSQRKQIDVQASQAILTELVKNLELSKLTLRKEMPLIQIIDKPILPLEKEKLGRTKGLILGGILGGFLIVLYLICKRILKSLMV